MNKNLMLNPSSLNNIKDQKEANRNQVYNILLEDCHNKIKNCSIKGKDSYIFYLVPEFYLGLPKYDLIKCSKYICNQLYKNGFKVGYTEPNFIYIDWNHIPSDIRKKEKKKKKKDNHRDINDYNLSSNFVSKII